MDGYPARSAGGAGAPAGVACVPLRQVLEDGLPALGLDLVEAGAGGADVGIAGERLGDEGRKLGVLVGRPPGVQRHGARLGG